jgi:hypothetical protein
VKDNPPHILKVHKPRLSAFYVALACGAKPPPVILILQDRKSGQLYDREVSLFSWVNHEARIEAAKETRQ